MKKILVFLLAIALLIVMLPMTALAADPSYNGDISGTVVITSAGPPPTFTAVLTGDYDFIIEGTVTGGSGNITTFVGTSTGDIVGTLHGTLSAMGLDTFFAVFDTITGGVNGIPVDPVYIAGIDGDIFEGQIITGPVPADVTSLTLGTEGGVTEVEVGATLQMTAVTVPVGPYNINWSIYVNDSAKASIDQNGLVTGLQTGSAIVIANTQDPTVAFDTFTITVVEYSETEISGDVEPTYTIVIPAAVDFGTMVIGSGIISQEFLVDAQNVFVEDGFHIEVGVTSDFVMKDKAGEGDISLAYSLENSVPTAMTTGATFTTFTGTRTENGEVSVNTADITKAGSYKGTMDFVISYEAD